MKPARIAEGIKDTGNITVQEILNVFNSTFNSTKTKANPTENVFGLILTKAEEVYQQNDGNPLDIKYKICISIAIRLIAERFMISQITDSNFHANIHKKQTGQIVEKYRNEYPAKINNIGIVDRVNLMTAENIHVNSFMYEPLMDLTDEHLRTLYSDVKTLN